MIRRKIVLLVILLVAALPAFPEIVIHTKDGRAIRVQVEANNIASIEFVSGASLPVTSFLSSLINGKQLSGEAWGDAGGNWKFELKLTSYNQSTGAIVGEITWLSLSSVHRIQGSLTGTTLTFTETEAIKAGGAHLNVAYTFTVGPTSATGTWVDNGDKSHGGAKFSAL